jgi:hypothetical protein
MVYFNHEVAVEVAVDVPIMHSYYITLLLLFKNIFPLLYFNKILK